MTVIIGYEVEFHKGAEVVSEMFPSKHKASQYAMSKSWGTQVYRCYSDGSKCPIPWDYRMELEH